MLGRDYGEAKGFDEQTLNELANLSFEDAFETAYSYLMQSELDADTILAPWLEPKDQM